GICRVYDSLIHIKYTHSLHDALQIFCLKQGFVDPGVMPAMFGDMASGQAQQAHGIGKASQIRLIIGHSSMIELACEGEADSRIRSEEHTSELQSREKLVCRLLL